MKDSQHPKLQKLSQLAYRKQMSILMHSESKKNLGKQREKIALGDRSNDDKISLTNSLQDHLMR
jgi:hypothetical protein